MHIIMIHVVIDDFTEEKQKQLIGMAYKYLGGDGNLPNIQQIITSARKLHPYE